MSTWGPGAFDNDDAADFAFELDDALEGERAALVRQVLEAEVRGDEFVEAEALAAVAIVAAQCLDGEPTDPVCGPQEPMPRLPVDLPPLALQALDCVIDGNVEVSPVWCEGESGRQWRVMVVRLRSILMSALEDPNQTRLFVNR
jgi:hypothetical protein